MSLDVETLLDRVRHGPDRLCAGRIILDRAGRRLLVDGQPQCPPKKEFELLELLMLHRGSALPRELLLACLWGRPDLPHDKTLDVHILRLRRRIETTPSQPRYIHTVRGFGYLFDPPTAPAPYRPKTPDQPDRSLT